MTPQADKDCLDCEDPRGSVVVPLGCAWLVIAALVVWAVLRWIS